MKIEYRELVARYVAEYGKQPLTRERRKLTAIYILTDATCACFYCQRALQGGRDAWLEHIDGDGAECRKEVSSREEIEQIVNGTHPNISARKFTCATCNNLKGQMSVDEFMQTDYMIEITANRILRERHEAEYESIKAALRGR